VTSGGQHRALNAALVSLAAAAALLVRTTPGHAAAIPAKCDSYGASWVRWFNKNAKAQGDPTRMLSACCEPRTIQGVHVHHCFVKLTLAGSTVAGCATYDLAQNGLPVSSRLSVGQHQNCPLPKKK
jgi:hypothetical protein